jgi:Concanavalin A-like lectin/glucanases superfamily
VAGTASGATDVAQTPGSYTEGAWHHVVATVSPGNGIRLYLDGALAATSTYTAPHNVTGCPRWAGSAVPVPCRAWISKVARDVDLQDRSASCGSV